MTKTSISKTQQQPNGRKRVVSKLLELFGGDIKTVFISPRRRKLIESFAKAQDYLGVQKCCWVQKKVEWDKGLIDMPMYKLHYIITRLRQEYERDKLRGEGKPDEPEKT